MIYFLGDVLIMHNSHMEEALKISLFHSVTEGGWPVMPEACLSTHADIVCVCVGIKSQKM